MESPVQKDVGRRRPPAQQMWRRIRLTDIFITTWPSPFFQYASMSLWVHRQKRFLKMCYTPAVFQFLFLIFNASPTVLSVSPRVYGLSAHILLSHRASVLLTKKRNSLHSWPVMTDHTIVAHEGPSYGHYNNRAGGLAQSHASLAEWVQGSFFSNTQNGWRQKGTKSLTAFGSSTLQVQVPNAIYKTPSKLSLETFSALHDGICGTVMEQSASTAKVKRYRYTILNTGNGEQDKAEAHAQGTSYTSSKNAKRNAGQYAFPMDGGKERGNGCMDRLDRNFNGSRQKRPFEDVAGTEGGKYLLIWVKCKLQAGHSNVHVPRRSSSGYPTIVNEKRRGSWNYKIGYNIF